MSLADVGALLTAGYFVVFGAGFLVRPELIDRLGLKWINPAGRTEVRCYYGAVSWALAGFMVFQVTRDEPRVAVTLALFLASAVLLARIVGTVVDDAQKEPYTRLAIPTETVFVFALALVLAAS